MPLAHKGFTLKYALIATMAVFIIWKFYPSDDSSPPPPKELVASSSASKVEVNVYYEVLCPDSVRFVRTQLHPAFSKLSEIMTYNLIPYGKASSTPKSTGGGYEFVCQHGEEECLGNMVHACSSKYVESKATLIEYVTCMIKNNRNPLLKGIKCAKEVNLKWGPIEKCVKSLEGEMLLFEEGEKTNALSPGLSFVPTVELNNSQGDQSALLTDLASQVCKAYTGNPIPACGSL